MNTFENLNLPTTVLTALKRMKFVEPTPIQASAIPVALSGRDLIASAQTGTGKTAAFGIPLVCRLLAEPGSNGLILAPTRELATQISDTLEQLCSTSPQFTIAVIMGGVNMNPQRRALAAKPRIIVATPGRLDDFLRQQPGVLKRFNYLVLDEADRMLDLGFAPQLRSIRKALAADRQTLMFSATFPSDIAELAKEWLKNPERVAIGSVSQPCAKIDQARVEVTSDTKNPVLLDELNRREGSVLIFARTKRRTDRLARFLDDSGVAVCRIHGDRSQGQRDAALKGFRDGRYRVLVATDIAARGIDIPHIEHVINYDLPVVADDYLHRIGRTARAGRSGAALCLVAPEERNLWRAIERLMNKPTGMHSREREVVRPGQTGRPQRSGSFRNRGGRNFRRSPHRSTAERAAH